jgi:hypothetical protein
VDPGDRESIGLYSGLPALWLFGNPDLNVFIFAIEMALAGSFSFCASAEELTEIITKVTIAREMIKNNLSSFPFFIYTPPP